MLSLFSLKKLRKRWKADLSFCKIVLPLLWSFSKLIWSDINGFQIQLDGMFDGLVALCLCVWRLEPGNHWELNWRQGGRGGGAGWRGGTGGNSQRPAHFSSSCPRPLARPSYVYAFNPQNPETAFFVSVHFVNFTARCGCRVRQGASGQRASRVQGGVQGRAKGGGCT